MPVSVGLNSTWHKTHRWSGVSDAWKPRLNEFAYQEGDGRWHMAYTYAWETGEWGPCSASCGGGTQTRELRCLRNDGVYVDLKFCDAYVP